MGSTRTRPHRGDRYDGHRVELAQSFNGIFPYLMRGRNESIVYFPMTFDMENLLAYLDARKGTDQAVTLFEAMMLALIKVLRARPALNRYIIGRRVYQREDIVLSFVAKREMSDEGEETNVLVTITPTDDRATILAKLRGEIRHAKQGDAKKDDQTIAAFLKLPRWALRAAVGALSLVDFYHDTPGFLRGMDPLRCTAYVANLGSVGANAPYHHLFEWGTCSIFIAIGRVGPAVVVGDDNQPVVRQTVRWRISLDERITDGYYDARSLDLIEEFFTHPEMLETV